MFKEECCKQCRFVKVKGTMTKMARTKTNTQYNTITRKTPRRNRYSEKTNSI